MSVNEELSEHAEHVKEPFERTVAVSMAIIAAALAVISVLGHIFANEELLAQQKASDQWAYYQAKSIRRYNSEIAQDLFKTVAGGAPAMAEKYLSRGEKYEHDEEEIQTEARKLETESKLYGRRALRMHAGEVFLEIGIVFASLAILTKKRLAFSGAMVSACVGVGIGVSTYLVH
jgi:hypothetical protein